MSDLQSLKLAADTVRLLSADGVQKAKSGHPGMPMGMADVAFVLWYKFLRHNPKNPEWLGRDRFVLSAGHGSMLLYSLLHLFEYGLTMEDLQNFRQWGSLTPGHPEYGHTKGVEVTTGPLGTGLASAIGMAAAARHFAAITGLDKTGLLDGKIYVIAGDGCMMEGISHEAASFAGHLRLDNLVVLYDNNNISIEGSTGLAFTENVADRFRSYGWRVLSIPNANDIRQVLEGLEAARVSDGRPTLVDCRTVIGYGSPAKAGSAKSHGEPLGVEELAATKAALGFPPDSFYVPSAVRDMVGARVAELEADAAKWDAEFQKFIEANPEKAALISDLLSRKIPENILESLLAVTPTEKSVATRVSSGTVLQKAAELVPSLCGGAADLAPSTKTEVKNGGDFSAENYAGRNFHFGVRELAMSVIANGMSVYGGHIPYTSTFFVFSDYMKPGIRLAALQKIRSIYVFTHDSFYVGEDGPTHQPIEQLVMLRSIPGMTVIRPAEAHEVAHAWAYALQSKTPVALVLTRQDIAPFPEEFAAKINLKQGAYVLSEDSAYDTILIATGSEVGTALGAAHILREKGWRIRVVSMPSRESFLAQDAAVRDAVLPPACERRVTIEAASTFGWEKFAGDKGLCIGLDHFGSSAPYKVLAEKFGFTPEAVADRISAYFA